MPRYGRASAANLEEAHPDLQKLMNFVIQHWDNSITDGGRTHAEQVANVKKGVSMTMNSKHLFVVIDGKKMSLAVDAAPYPIKWPDITRGLNALKKADPDMQCAEFFAFIGFVQGCAAVLGIKIRVGIDWDSDRDFGDHSFIDMPHIELILEK